MHQLDEFRQFNTDGLSIDQMIGLSQFGKQLKAEYESHQLEVPEWVEDQLKVLKREITARSADAREARLKEIDSRLAALESNEEKRKKLQEERERLAARV